MPHEWQYILYDTWGESIVYINISGERGDKEIETAARGERDFRPVERYSGWETEKDLESCREKEKVWLSKIVSNSRKCCIAREGAVEKKRQGTVEKDIYA